MTRVQEDCLAGDQWACDLLDALSHPLPAEDIEALDGVKDDVDAILRGIDRARTAPRISYPFVPRIADGLPTSNTTTKFSPPLQSFSRGISHWPRNPTSPSTSVTLELSVVCRSPKLPSALASVLRAFTFGRPTVFDHGMLT